MLNMSFRPSLILRRVRLALLGVLGANLSKYRSIEKVSHRQPDILSRRASSDQSITQVPAQNGGFGHSHFVGKRHLYSISDVEIRGREAGIFSRDFLLAESSSWPPQEALRDMGKKWIGSSERTRQRVIPLPQTSYYHWLIEDLPSFLLALQEDPRAAIATKRNPPKYVSTFLDFLGHSPVIFFSRSLHADVVTFNSKGGIVGVPQKPDIAKLRDFFDVSERPPLRRKAVYISRARASRSPLGESWLEEELARADVEIHRLENSSFAQQVELFKGATLIIGPHGAGLSNMVFMPRGEVIEIGNPSWPNPCFEILSNVCGHSYRSVFLDGQIDPESASWLLDAAKKHLEFRD